MARYGLVSPYRTHIPVADNTRLTRDDPGGLKVNDLDLDPYLWLTDSVTAP